MTEEKAVLDGCPFFERFQPKHMEKLAQLGARVKFAKDEVLFRVDDQSSLFYVILSGRVALEAEIAGQVLRIQTLYAGDELGWSAVLNRKKQFQARALEPVETVAFEAAVLRDAFDTNPYFGRAFLERLVAVVAERLQGTRLQLATALAREPEKAAQQN
jgi:CRP-like cAMP-binding protein